MADINSAALRAKSAALLVDIQPQLDRADTIRIEKYAQYCRRRKIAVCVVAVLVPLLAGLFYLAAFVWAIRIYDFLILAAVALTGGMYHWMTAPKRAYARLYKQSVLPQIAAAYGLSYRMDGRIPDRELLNGGIAPAYDTYHSEDYFEGAYKGARVRFAEIKLTQQRGSGKTRRTVTVFKGLAVIIKMPKVMFYGHTIVVKNGAKMAEWMRERFGALKRADLVDPVFERKYSVFTTDQVEARYLLHPAMIERINTLEQPQVKMRDALSVAYRDGCVFMLLPAQGDLFEPADITIPATDPHALDSVRGQVAGLLGVIDQLEFYQPPQQS